MASFPGHFITASLMLAQVPPLSNDPSNGSACHHTVCPVRHRTLQSSNARACSYPPLAPCLSSTLRRPPEEAGGPYAVAAAAAAFWAHAIKRRRGSDAWRRTASGPHPRSRRRATWWACLRSRKVGGGRRECGCLWGCRPRGRGARVPSQSLSSQSLAVMVLIW